ncbi:MAG: AAA family ATPase, partial [Prevotella sp.]|nr:AAA family ATPase [Prevotella sp.]
KSIYIKKLFGIYTYTLDLNPICGDSIRFLTGPNGYGKTTILNILNSLYSWNLKSLSLIPFESLMLLFDDAFKVDVERVCESIGDKEPSDESASEIIELHLSFSGNNGHTKILSTIWTSNNEYDREDNNSLSLYLMSHPVYYITDRRLKKGESSLSVNINADKMRRLLKDFRVLINEALSIESSSIDFISEEEYYTKKERLEEDLNILISCEVLPKDILPTIYCQNDAKRLKTLIDIISDCIEAKRLFINKLKCFCQIIERSDFADKKLIISHKFGYRFVLQDKDKTIILPENLSSGEQNILIMVYDLLFNVDDASLVLIDSPEVSFHLVWQMDFLKNLSEITSLRNLQCIVSTHSPEVFSNKFFLAVDLFKQLKAQEGN